MSGYADMEDEGRGVPPGAHVAPKPWTLEELSRAVGEALAGAAVAGAPG